MPCRCTAGQQEHDWVPASTLALLCTPREAALSGEARSEAISVFLVYVYVSGCLHTHSISVLG